MVNGWIILDKPSGITSAHAVEKVKRLLKKPKIGHAGTLDPLASGILPLALGEATKTVAYMMDGAKSYSFTVTWGQERDTDDSQGQVTRESAQRPTVAAIEALLPEFTGLIQQIPPDYSAIKVGGKRAYDMARDGEIGMVKAREVLVQSLVVTPSPLRGEGWGGGESHAPNAQQAHPHPTLPPQGGGLVQETSFLCHCGKGTYIRSLARDMGQRLGCFGYISALRRLSVAAFNETHAISLEVLEKMIHKGDLLTVQGTARSERVWESISHYLIELGFLWPVEAALDDILAWDITSDQAAQLRRGQTVALSQSIPDDTVMLAKCEGQLIAICIVAQGSAKTVRGFNL